MNEAYAQIVRRLSSLNCRKIGDEYVRKALAY